MGFCKYKVEIYLIFISYFYLVWNVIGIYFINNFRVFIMSLIIVIGLRDWTREINIFGLYVFDFKVINYLISDKGIIK